MTEKKSKPAAEDIHKTQLQRPVLKKKAKAARTQKEKSGKNELAFQMLFQNHPMPMWVIDIKTHAFLRVNKAAIEKYGYSQTDFQKLTLKDIHPEERITGQWHHKLKSGKLIDVEVTSCTFDFQGHESILMTAQDITACKQTGDSLRASEIFNQAILDSVTAEIAVLDHSGIIIAVNQTWEKFALENSAEAGIPAPQTGIGVNYLEICKAENGLETGTEGMNGCDGIRAVMSGKLTRFSMEYACHSPEQQRWYTLTATPLGEGGAGVVVTHNNITERKLVEESLHESQSTLQGILQSTADGILAVNLENKVLFANEQFYKMWKIPREIALNQDETVLLNFVLEQLIEPQIFLQKVQELYQSKQKSFDTLYFKDGRIFERQSKPIVNGENLEGRVWSFHDITETKTIEAALIQSESRYRNLYDTMTDGFVRVNMQGFIQESNKSYQKMTGYNANELAHLTYEDITPKKWHEFEQNIVETQILPDGSSNFYEKEYIKKDGTIFPIEIHSFLIKNDEGENEGIWAIVRDITERKQAEEELRQRIMELELLYESGLSFSQLLNPKQIAQQIIKLLDQKMDWHHTAIRLLNPINNTLELLAFNQANLSSQKERNAAEEKLKTSVAYLDQGLSGWAVQHGTIVHSNDLANDPRYQETFSGLQSGLYVPIKIGKQVIGVISIESEKANAFSKSDERLTVTLAAQAASMFENARLYEETTSHADELENRVKERTAQIESTKHRLELATHAGQIGVWEYNPRENKVIWDERMYMLHHIPDGSFDGTYQSWVKLIHPDDIDKSQLNIQLAVTKYLLLNNEHRIIWPDGTIRNIAASAVTVFANDGRPERIIGINMDITDRKRTEQSLHESETYARLLFNAVPDPISVTDIHGEIIDINQAFEQHYNFSRDEIQGKNISEIGLYPEDDLIKREKYLSEIAEDQAGNSRQHSIQLNVSSTNENIQTIELRSYSIEVKGRQLILNAGRDITAYKKAEDTLQLANMEMKHALRIKDEFLANMSHELRTPLNAILGISESLEEQIIGALNEKQLKYIRIINESGRHLLELINDILDLSKIEAGKLELNLQDISVKTLCDSSLRLVKELAQKKSLKVSLEIDETEITLLGDERRLKQSLVNLLSNAVKFTQEGKEIGLQVQTNMIDHEITFTVWDQGIGIEQSDIKRLFKPFVQLDAGLAREYPGTGLGLAIVSQMVRLHGGHINLESEPGKGSRFIVTLPWAEKQQTAQIEIESQITPTSPKSAAKRSVKVLLVEDTEVVITLTSDYLHYKGYEVFIARNGMEGVLLAKEKKPDVILMDIMMPVMDGMEAARRIRADNMQKDTIIIALTALAMPGDREQCLAAGMDDYMSKPIQMHDLTKIIEKHLSARQEKK